MYLTREELLQALTQRDAPEDAAPLYEVRHPSGSLVYTSAPGSTPVVRVIGLHWVWHNPNDEHDTRLLVELDGRYEAEFAEAGSSEGLPASVKPRRRGPKGHPNRVLRRPYAAMQPHYVGELDALSSIEIGDAIAQYIERLRDRRGAEVAELDAGMEADGDSAR